MSISKIKLVSLLLSHRIHVCVLCVLAPFIEVHPQHLTVEPSGIEDKLSELHGMVHQDSFRHEITDPLRGKTQTGREMEREQGYHVSFKWRSKVAIILLMIQIAHRLTHTPAHTRTHPGACMLAFAHKHKLGLLMLIMCNKESSIVIMRHNIGVTSSHLT